MTLKDQWTLANDVIYLNHGSFGPSPRCVQQARADWTAQLESQPMDFFIRRLEDLFDVTCERLGAFVDAPGRCLALVDNATVAMNIIAASIDLAAGDQVLFTDHEYGAVRRIWSNKCRESAALLRTVELPPPRAGADTMIHALFEAVTDRTRVIVASHVTSATALVLPIEDICQEARRRGIMTCIDGPHAVAMRPLSLRQMGCDFYAASGHKWLSAPFGSGFLYVHGRHHGQVRTPLTSWGASLSGRGASWKDDFQWIGTRDPAPLFAMTAAIDFLEDIGIDTFRHTTHELARSARRVMADLTGLEPFQPDSDEWFGSMVTVPLPAPPNFQPITHGMADPLQLQLRERYGIEVPIVSWKGQRLMRVSCHLYNSQADIDTLVDAIRTIDPVTC